MKFGRECTELDTEMGGDVHLSAPYLVMVIFGRPHQHFARPQDLVNERPAKGSAEPSC